MESFRALAAKLTILKINPIALLTPPSTKGGGNFILSFWQKILKYIPRKNVESFRALAAKLTILKINPFALLTPPSTEGGWNLILPI